MSSLEIQKVVDRIAGYKTLQIPPTIKTNHDYKKASDSVKFINDRLKFAEEARKKIVDPLVKEKKKIDEKFKEITNPLTDLIYDVKQKMLAYMQKKEAEQIAYEKKKLAESTESELLVIDKVQKIKDSEFSSNTKITTTKYRVKDKTLIEIVEIKQLKFKQWLDVGNKCPDYVETYEEESIMVRSK